MRYGRQEKLVSFKSSLSLPHRLGAKVTWDWRNIPNWKKYCKVHPAASLIEELKTKKNPTHQLWKTSAFDEKGIRNT